jgi:hypothetical protein
MYASRASAKSACAASPEQYHFILQGVAPVLQLPGARFMLGSNNKTFYFVNQDEGLTTPVLT